MLTFYRVLVILFSFCGMAVALTHEFPQPFLKLLSVLGLSVALLTLLLFANLCADVRSIRNRDDSFSINFGGSGEDFSGMLKSKKSDGDWNLTSLPTRDVGDRRFKADATKVCKTCRFVNEGKMECSKDHLSLQGITINAVGCQYWELGLTVAESPEPLESEEVETEEGANAKNEAKAEEDPNNE